MKKTTKLVLAGASIVTGAFATYYLIKKRREVKKIALEYLDKIFNAEDAKKIKDDANKRTIIGFNVEDSVLLYQTPENDIKALYLLEDKEETCRIYIPSESTYTTFSILYGEENVEYLMEINDFATEDDYSFEIGIYCSKTGKFIDALAYDAQANVFIKE